MEQVRPRSPGETPRSMKSWVELATAMVGLLAAVIGIAFGLTSHKSEQNAQQQTTTAQRQADDGQARIQELEGQLTSAKKSASDLQAQLDSVASTDATDTELPANTEPPTNGGYGIFHQGIVTVAYGGRIDLDAPIDDPQWGLLSSSGQDFAWAEGATCTFCLLGNDRVIVDKSANYDTCATTTGYGKDALISLDKVKAGLAVCVVTSKDRFALLIVTSFKGSKQPLTLKVTTFKTAKD